MSPCLVGKLKCLRILFIILYVEMEIDVAPFCSKVNYHSGDPNVRFKIRFWRDQEGKLYVNYLQCQRKI